MATRSDQDMDDDFSEIYKEYTGPQMTANSSAAKGGANSSGGNNGNKRSLGGFSDEEEKARDPNAVPTDFTSREAKVWEAKSKATERNWKKRKEEEMICKICGDSGHFTQLMVMRELEVAQAILNLLVVLLTLATLIDHMMVMVWGVIKLIDGMLRDGDQTCNLVISLNTPPTLRTWKN